MSLSADLIPDDFPRLMDLRAVLFDLDGTLVDTEAIHLRLHKQTLEPLGVVISEQDIENNVGTNNDLQFYQRLLSRHQLRVPAGHDLSSWAAALVAQKNAETDHQLRTETIPLKPGVTEMITTVRAAGLPYAIVTATKRDLVDIIVDHCGFKPDVLVTHEDYDRPKPDPMPYNLALERLGITAQQAIACEDSKVGIASAVAAGLPTLAMSGLISKADQLALGARFVIDDFNDYVRFCHHH